MERILHTEEKPRYNGAACWLLLSLGPSDACTYSFHCKAFFFIYSIFRFGAIEKEAKGKSEKAIYLTQHGVSKKYCGIGKRRWSTRQSFPCKDRCENLYFPLLSL